MQIIVDNIATEYADEGRGPVILFLHGWQDNLHTFDAIANILAQDYRIIRLDLPGFGKTGLPPLTWKLDDYINFVASFVRKLDLNLDYLLGHSFGGRIAIKALAENKLRPKKAVLIAAAGIAKSGNMRNQAFKVAAKIGKAVTSVPPFRSLRMGLRSKLYKNSGSDYLRTGPLKQIYLNIIQEDLSNYAEKISTPTLLVWGATDAQTPVEDGKFFNRAIQNAKLVVIPHATHFVHQDEPEKVASLIREFYHA